MFIKNRFKFRAHKATTIAEMIVTLTIFAVVAMLAINSLSNTLKASKKIQSEVFVYTEAQALMDNMARYIERNGIDYEAYFAREVLGETDWMTSSYGIYGQRFYDPGTDGVDSDLDAYTETEGYYGISCRSVTGSYPDDCPAEIPDFTEGDTNEGLHPFPDLDPEFSYTGPVDAESMNAFCVDETDDASADCVGLAVSVVDELILINGDGDERWIFAREENANGSDYSLGRISMTATDGDGDGIAETWACTEDAMCDGQEDDLTDGDDLDQNGFMPISPENVTIEEFYVVIAPAEDPFKAFAEYDVQIQPQVTIVMTVSLSDSFGARLIGDPPSITVQRTVSTGVYSEIVSYE